MAEKESPIDSTWETEGDLAWLSRADAIIAEFHPTLVDMERIVARIEQEGFPFILANTVFPDNTTAFLRA